jgi:hypothetical protein
MKGLANWSEGPKYSTCALPVTRESATDATLLLCCRWRVFCACTYNINRVGKMQIRVLRFAARNCSAKCKYAWPPCLDLVWARTVLVLCGFSGVVARNDLQRHESTKNSSSLRLHARVPGKMAVPSLASPAPVLLCPLSRRSSVSLQLGLLLFFR